MGVYIGLDIIPNKINKEEWKKVYIESLELIRAYPFAEYILDEYNGEERYVLDIAKEKLKDDNFKESRYWKIYGDLKTKETGEVFNLYYDLSKYEKEYDSKNNDILLSFIGDAQGEVTVFNSKTQGKDYHIYVLAIACLIESRFPKYACVYGNISKNQAEQAVKWGNSILEKPIYIPIRVDEENLSKRLKKIAKREELIDSYNQLIISEKKYQLDKWLLRNFSRKEIYSWFIKEFKDYSSIKQYGAQSLMIKFLNSNYPLEDLCEICCLIENGPNFNKEEFISAMAQILIFIPKEYREFMKVFEKPSHIVETVTYQFATIFFNMKYSGRHSEIYIPIEEGYNIIKRKFEDYEKLNKSLSKKVEEVSKNLKQHGKVMNEKLNELEIEKIYDENIIDDCNELMYYNENSIVSEKIIALLTTFKNIVNKGIESGQKNFKHFMQINDKVKLIEFLIKVTNNMNVVLTRSAWDYIESIDELENLRRLLFVAALCNDNKLRKIALALLENKELSEKWCLV